MYAKAAVSTVVFQNDGTTVRSDVSVDSGDLKGRSTNLQSSIRIIRYYLTTLSPAALDAESLHNELAMRAKIILEYMIRYAIADVNQGIRQFTAFERERLHRLGMIAPAKRRFARLRKRAHNTNPPKEVDALTEMLD